MAAATTQSSRKRGSRRRNRPSPRERLLASATHLFSTEGIRVIGIDRILREADVAKASLYSLFGSKDALVIAYLRKLDEDWRNEWYERTESMTDPQEKILAFFDQCIDAQPEADYRGSHFQNAANEYPKPETDTERGIVDAVRDHRRWTLDTLTELLTELNGYPGLTQAKQMLIFVDGGLAGSRLERSVAPLVTAKELATGLLGAPPADYCI
ncbi:TetR/AcrR family transcriptional regulator [Corynebacterium mendelii]|uniref:TetR/AcrR family transcriptional regulator n=1 Tax=Corynebacterium mendelii TaxID=2765362 RepID=A0A939IWI9_9CORY|nr:TetR/AcrR family transcriptional regulator [Corynebacterium mendelii]